MIVSLIAFSGASLVGASAYGAECIPLSPGIVLNKYYLKECNACKMIAPIVDEIKSKLQRNSIEVKVREVECTECECPGITAFPTVAITNDKKMTGMVTGYRDYSTLSRWVAEELKVDPTIFDKIVKHGDRKVTTLTAKDFLSGFDGQWMILFYSSASEDLRKAFHKVAETSGVEIHFGEVTKHEAAEVTNRFNITEYPYVVGINHGTIVPYAGPKTVEGLAKFADRLGKRSFESLTYSQLKDMAAGLKNGEPIYVVLYKNYEIASHYYNDLAQQFKFKAVIYKSNDPAMFEAAGAYPEEMPAEGEHKPSDHSKMVQLVVYKNGAFYQAPSSLENGSDIIQWIFHTHFSHVTRVNNENFYSVFHGIKPVLLLLSSGEELNEELNNLSADMHLGMPYTNILFASIDADEYPQFHKEVLEKVLVPGLAIYNPLERVWYYEKERLNRENFEKTARGVIEKFFANKLARYPPRPSMWKYYMLALWVIGAIGFFCLRGMSTRHKIE